VDVDLRFVGNRELEDRLAARRHPQAMALAGADTSSIDRVQRHLWERLRAANSMNPFGARIGLPEIPRDG
jgi:hypothetical protein